MKNIQFNKIGIFRTDRLGDMILTLPMIKILKDINPNSEIYLFANKYTEPLLFNQPDISQYIFIDDVKEDLTTLLKKLNLNMIFFPRPRFKEVFAAFKARIPIRVGSGFRWYSIFLNHKVFEHRKNGLKNESEYNLSLISSITKESYNVKLLKPFISEEAKSKVELILQENNINNQIIIVHPGGGDSAPKWPASYFGEFAKHIVMNNEFNVVITGTKNELQLCDEVQALATNSFNFCSKFNLLEMIALLDKAEFVVTNSTGIIHIAAALNKKILGFYPDSPNIGSVRWGPMNHKKIILTPQNSSSHIESDDLSLISVKDAIEAFYKLQKF